MKAVARRMPGRARLQYLLAHAKARTENRPGKVLGSTIVGARGKLC